MHDHNITHTILRKCTAADRATSARSAPAVTVVSRRISWGAGECGSGCR